MDNNESTINDILESLSIRINDTLRPDKKSKNKKNNAYFWAFKLLLLLVLLYLLCGMFDGFRHIGVAIIYALGKSLRSVMSGIWSFSVELIKNIVVLYLLYDNFKTFVNSEYYDILYANNKKLRNRKENVFYVVELVLKVFAVFSMIVIGLLGILFAYAFVIVIIMLIKNIYIISPLIIFGALFLLTLLTCLHIKNKFFDTKQTIKKNHYIFTLSVLIIGVIFLNYELSSYEYVNGLPIEMETSIKEQVFELNENTKINLKNNSKLNNISIEYDDKLDDKMYISFEYFKTADVRYTYELNEEDDLDLTFSSSLDFKPRNVNDVFQLIHSTFNRKTIYNYNLFKYPNITIRINPKYKELLTLK